MAPQEQVLRYLVFSRRVLSIAVPITLVLHEKTYLTQRH